VKKHIYILFNKPYGVVSQFTEAGGHKSLKEFGFPEKVRPAGRLDHDSEGLLLLTDDGVFQNRLCSPKFGHPRKYLVQVERIPEETSLNKLRKGIMLNDGPAKPCLVRIITEPALEPRTPPIRSRKTVPTAWAEITLTEGRNRQVRRMFAAIGYPVLRLFRREIAGLTAQNLKAGQWRLLSDKELPEINFKPVKSDGRYKK